MKYTAGQAAKATGKSVPTITRAIKTGTISAEKKNGGGYLIDPAELHRVFPAVTRYSNMKPQTLGHETPILDHSYGDLERLVTTLQEQVADLRADRDGWRQQAERLALRLPAPSPEEPVAAPPAARGGGFWRRLWGRGGNA